jgi:site-specific DNA-methyltransferase (adenine-specific)
MFWVYLGVDQVNLPRHQLVIHQPYSLLIQINLISVIFNVVNHIGIHAVNLSFVSENQVYLADNLAILRTLSDSSIDLIYIDPPFNTGRTQERKTRKSELSSEGNAGFKGKSYKQIVQNIISYDDAFVDYWDFLLPRLIEAKRIMKESATLYLHLDYREAHYAKVMLDELFGRENFLNEIIWAYDYGGKSKGRWPSKHDTILVYVKDQAKYQFDSTSVDREPYMAPGLVTKEKAERGKLPTDVWWHTIVSPTGKEKTGYPTQKPVGILRRIIQASSQPGDLVLDFFAGSGTTALVSAQLGRRFIAVDKSPDAIAVISERLTGAQIKFELITKA